MHSFLSKSIMLLVYLFNSFRQRLYFSLNFSFNSGLVLKKLMLKIDFFKDKSGSLLFEVSSFIFSFSSIFKLISLFSVEFILFSVLSFISNESLFNIKFSP